jgi:hypothetical protein
MPNRANATLHAALPSICCALVLAACQPPAAPLDAKDLSLAASDIASMAAEAALLTGQAEAGAVTENFTWVHQEALGKASAELGGKLARPVPPAARRRYEQLLQLHAGLDGTLQQLGFAAHDAAGQEELRARFTRIHSLAAALRDRQ